MRRPIARGTGVLLGALLAGAGVGNAAPPKSGILEYQVTLTAPQQPARKMGQKIWMKGKNFRVEMTMTEGGRSQKQVTIGNATGVYLHATGMPQAMKLPGQARDIPGMMLGDVEKLRKQKKLGSEKVGQYQADIYEQSTAVNMPGPAQGQKMSTRFWLTRALPVPVKIVSQMPANFQSTAVLKSARLNEAVADSLFQLPKGVKVAPMPTQPGGMGGPPGGRPR